MTTTDQTTTPAKGTKHAHGLTATDKALADLAARVATAEGRITGQADILADHLHQLDDHEARITALENPAPLPDPVPPPATVTVRSIADLYAALANNEPRLTLAPGVYSGSIEIDARFAARTVPGVIDCTGAVLDGGGGVNRGRIAFRGGAHSLDFGGLTLANSVMNNTGAIQFDGWGEPACHHISLRKFKVLESVRRANVGSTTDHGVYFSSSQGGSHDILIEDLDVDATNPMGLASGVHMDHGNANAWNVTVRRFGFRGFGPAGPSVQYPIILWLPPVHDWTFDGATIQNASGNAVRFESQGASNIAFRNIVSTGSYGGRGFYSSLGTYPNVPGCSFSGCSFG